MQIQVPVVVEMTDQQVKDYAAEYGLPVKPDGMPYAKNIVEDVRSYILTSIQESSAFGEVGAGNGARGATVTLKR